MKRMIYWKVKRPFPSFRFRLMLPVSQSIKFFCMSPDTVNPEEPVKAGTNSNENKTGRDPSKSCSGIAFIKNGVAGGKNGKCEEKNDNYILNRKCHSRIKKRVKT